MHYEREANSQRSAGLTWHRLRLSVNEAAHPRTCSKRDYNKIYLGGIRTSVLVISMVLF